MYDYPDVYDVLEHEMREYDKKYEQWLATRPACRECKEPIAEEFAFKFDGDWICEWCLVDNHKWRVDKND